MDSADQAEMARILDKLDTAGWDGLDAAERVAAKAVLLGGE